MTHAPGLSFRVSQFPFGPTGDAEDEWIEYFVPWQTGPVREVGVNGVQADDVLEQVLDYLRAVNTPPYGSRETSLAITNIEQGLMWLRERTRQREARGVEGTSQP